MQLMTSVMQTLPSQQQVDDKPVHSLTPQKFDQDVFSDDFQYDYDWDTTTDEDLEFLSSPPWVSRSSSFSNQTSSGSGSELFTPPPPKCATFQPQNIPPPPSPFNTPPKLLPVEQVMRDHPGIDVARLRKLTFALAWDAIFGREELARCSLSGRTQQALIRESWIT